MVRLQITVWALPRMEEMPVLTCPLHPKTEKDEEDIARALTPTKSIPMAVSVQNPPEGLFLPGNELSFHVPCSLGFSGSFSRLFR